MFSELDSAGISSEPGLRWRVMPLIGEVPAQPVEPAAAVFADARLWRLPNGFRLQSTTAVFDIDDSVGSVVAICASDYDHTMLSFVALHLMLHSRGMYALHAAGAEVEGRALLLVGGSGSGKSTTLWNVLNAYPQATWLSDDTLYVVDGGREIVGLPREFHLDPLVAGSHPQLDAARDSLPRYGGKLSVAVRRYLPNRVRATTALPRDVIFPSIVEEEETSVTLLPRVEAFSRLLGSSGLALLDLPRSQQHFRALRDLCESSRHWQLRLGRDAQRKPYAVMSRLVSTLVEAR